MGASKPFDLHRAEGLERVKGIEPSYSAWKAAALPLSYTRLSRGKYQISEASESQT
jgi:hypothetical protein